MMGRSQLQDQTSLSSRQSNSHHRNVFRFLSRREVCPRSKHVPKRRWGEAYECGVDSTLGLSESLGDAKHGLDSWVEAESLQHLSAKYCPLVPPPRSTIAAAFSHDGRTLASTHGDHTVKIIDCQTGKCLKVLSGHRRTPWVVRFHPLHPEIIASGSLDHEVRLWDANSSECIGSRDFYRPIASIAFHAEGELLAVASGHKLYIWHYNKKGEASPPTIVLRTRRSLRAVHFHPHAAPFLLTAEVNDLDSSDSSMTRATSQGYLRYPPPAVFVANVHPKDHISVGSEVPLMSLPFLILPSFSMDDSRTDLQHASRHAGSNSRHVGSSVAMQLQMDAVAAEKHPNVLSPMDASPAISSGTYPNAEDTVNNNFPNEMRNGVLDPIMDAMEAAEVQPVRGSLHGNSGNLGNHGGANNVPCEVLLQTNNPGSIDLGQLNQVWPSRDPTGWEMPFLQGWLMGQSQAGIPSMLPQNGASHEHAAQRSGPSTSAIHLSTHNTVGAGSTLTVPGGVYGRSDLQDRFPHSHFTVSESGEGAASINAPRHYGADAQPIVNRIQSELATSLAAAAAAELPCTVKLRVWWHDSKSPSTPLTAERCRLTIPHAVLCSEMGAHFSPCGRFLAACVACMLPHVDADPGLQTLFHQEPGAATSPTRHPISAHQVMYELRIYSLEEATFGVVLVSRAIRAAHCLTSIQFSPTSEHILLAYGRRHGSLLKSIVIDGEMTSPVYTVLESSLSTTQGPLGTGAFKASTDNSWIIDSGATSHMTGSLDEGDDWWGRESGGLYYLDDNIVSAALSVSVDPLQWHYRLGHPSLQKLKQVYRVSDMELVRVLTSSEDEVNVACFHPFAGGGIVYGTKEGKLRVLRYDTVRSLNCTGSNYCSVENTSEVQTYALEC